MKKIRYSLWFLALLVPAVSAQDRIYRCGNEYTNSTSHSKDRNCKLVEGGNVTVIQSKRPAPPPAAAASSGAGATPSAATASAPSPSRLVSNDQRARDADARAILESELRKAEGRLAELTRDNNYVAALDLRNPQIKAEHAAELKTKVARAESDVAGIRRELARLAPKP